MKLSLASRILSCPYYQCPDVRRSRRRKVFEKALRFVITPWRCEVCGNRFYGFSWVKPFFPEKQSKHVKA